ncbi:calpain-like cysteine peptidase [Trypanosoma conorhini]|uniref:Calpain-like cysteine peptidase n=1 Tax=Trypanosoma conorhini TaxID=83891 RepID=A0A422PQX2_9TRYP|nr:calpain-like cysteine peptidase [Trypanosoma conorhini]RNF20124.1 calpain-like cysteine peptidase [Trypanosoma conorhini]
MGGGASAAKGGETAASTRSDSLITHASGIDAGFAAASTSKGILKNGQQARPYDTFQDYSLEWQLPDLATPCIPLPAAQPLPVTIADYSLHGTASSRHTAGLVDHCGGVRTDGRPFPAQVYNYQGRGCGRFKHGYPALCGGDDVIPIPLLTDVGGVVFCYRILSVDGSRWSFYNDTVTYELEVVCVFSAASQIQALGLTSLHERSDGRAELRLVVHPGETQEFASGDVERYEEDIRLSYVSRAFIGASARACEPFLRDEKAGIYALLAKKGKKAEPGNRWGVTSEELLRWCVGEHVPFLDLEFLPNFRSLVGREAETESQVLCGWCKPKNYIPAEAVAGEPRVLRSLPRPMNVGVSLTGGQGVVCALAILAEDFAAVERLFRHPMGRAAAAEEQHMEASRVTLCKSGWWTAVVVDHYFPVLNMKLLGGKCIDDPAELWVAVVEKAYAKLRGSYLGLAATDALRALEELTGYPTCRWDGVLQDAGRHEELFDKLCRFCELGFTVVLDRPNLASGERAVQRLGLEKGSACVVLGVKRFQPMPVSGDQGKDSQAGTHRLVRIRNPFGSSRDWIGAWNWGDPAWRAHPAIAAQCGFGRDEADDGSFWMEWRDVVRCFRGCGACFTHNSFYEYRVEGSFGRGGVPGCVIKLEVSRSLYVMGMLQPELQGGGGGGMQPVLLQLSRRRLAEEQPRRASVKRSEGRQQEVVLNSTADCDCPSPSVLTFRASPQVSLIAALLPEHSPYYLIPRTTSTATAAAYVLGLFTSAPCGDGGEGAPAARSASLSASASFPPPPPSPPAAAPSCKPNSCVFPQRRKFLPAACSLRCRRRRR